MADTLESLLREARKIIRASSQRNLAKDWDKRATAALQGTTCEWSQDDVELGTWQSACGGNPWRFEADDPTKNGMRYCIHCGKRMVQAAEEK